ncbi:MAG: hypothetical protein K8T20_14985 [Planctomycetes bacterium]|nr:hypothetical protein [Planctomycetota bacterium]
MNHEKSRIAGLAAAALVAALGPGCGPPDISRSQMNPRKEAVYKYVQSLCESDQNSTVMGSGAGPQHPARFKPNPPTLADMEAAIGKADLSQAEPPSAPEEGKEPAVWTAYWWEKDSTWEVPGIHKKGFREIIIAGFAKDGRLVSLMVLWPYGCEQVGRSSFEWKWIG